MLLLLTITFTVLASFLFGYQAETAATPLRREKIKDQYVNAMFLFFGIMTGLRNVAVGPDTFSYYLQFQQACKLSLQSAWINFVNYYVNGIGKDEGFPIVMKLFSYVFPSYRIFLFFNAFVFYSGAAYIIRRNTRTQLQAFLAIILFITLFLPYAISAVRQSFAIGCVMWSYKFIRQRKLLPFLIIILLASTVHKSVLIFIPYYWIAAIKNVRALSFAAVLLIPVMFMLARPLTVLLVDVSNSAQYAYYLAENKAAGTPTFTALLICCLLMYLSTIGKFNQSIPSHHYFTNTIFLTVGLCPVTWVVPDYMRILLYFSCFLPVIMANSITMVPGRTIRRCLTLVFTLVVTYLFIKNIPPYEFFWNNMDLGSNYGYTYITRGI